MKFAESGHIRESKFIWTVTTAEYLPFECPSAKWHPAHMIGGCHEYNAVNFQKACSVEQRQTNWPEVTSEIEGYLGDPYTPAMSSKEAGSRTF